MPLRELVLALMQLITRLLLVSIALVLPACDTDSPKGVVEVAFVKLMKSDAKGFTKLLTGPALARLGTEQAMAKYRRKLEGLNLHVCGVQETPQSTYEVSVCEKDSTGDSTTLEILEVICVDRGPSVTSGKAPGFPGYEWYSGRNCKIRDIR